MSKGFFNELLWGFLIGTLTAMAVLFILTDFAVAADPQLPTDTNKYKVAVIDSGFSPVLFSTAGLKLCNEGHFDFTTGKANVGVDEVGHGAYVTDLINKHAGETKICFLIYKIFPASGYTSFDWLNKALIMAYKNKAHVINLSLASNKRDRKLKRIMRVITKRGVKVFTAAGNESDNLNETCMIYPQCFRDINKNMVLVGALNAYARPSSYTNKGIALQVWHMGDYQSFGVFGRGTSFAAPRAAGDYLSTLPEMK